MKILSKDEIATLKSMVIYWDEVWKREDKNPLNSELCDVIRMLGIKILWIIKDYIRLLEN